MFFLGGVHVNKRSFSWEMGLTAESRRCWKGRPGFLGFGVTGVNVGHRGGSKLQVACHIAKLKQSGKPYEHLLQVEILLFFSGFLTWSQGLYHCHRTFLEFALVLALEGCSTKTWAHQLPWQEMTGENHSSKWFLTMLSYAEGVSSVELLDKPPEKLVRAVTTPDLDRYTARP